MLRFLNGSSSLLSTMAEGPRADRRKNVTVPVLVIPLKKRRLLIDRVFAATRDVSARGVSLVVRIPRELGEIVSHSVWEHRWNRCRKGQASYGYAGRVLSTRAANLEDRLPSRVPRLESIRF